MQYDFFFQKPKVVLEFIRMAKKREFIASNSLRGLLFYTLNGEKELEEDVKAKIMMLQGLLTDYLDEATHCTSQDLVKVINNKI